MEKKVFNRKLVWLAGLTLLTAIVWVSLQSYHHLVRRDRLEDVDQLLTPFNPNLDVDVLDKISNQREFQIEEVAEYLRAEPVPEISEEESEEIFEEEFEEEGDEPEEAVELESQPSEATQSGEADE